MTKIINITERELLERLRSNLMERKTEDVSELHDEIVRAFEDTEIDGEAEVVVEETYYKNVLEAYLNHIDSPVYLIKYKKSEDGSCVVTVVTNVSHFF